MLKGWIVTGWMAHVDISLFLLDRLTAIIMMGIEAGLPREILPIRYNQDEFDLDHNGKRDVCYD